MLDYDFIKLHSDGTISTKTKEKNVYIVNVSSIKLNFAYKNISKNILC